MKITRRGVVSSIAVVALAGASLSVGAGLAATDDQDNQACTVTVDAHDLLPAYSFNVPTFADGNAATTDLVDVATTHIDCGNGTSVTTFANR